MIHYSVLMPLRDATSAASRLLPPLCQALQNLTLPFEILCLDDGSAPRDANALAELLIITPHLRVLRFDEPRGRGAALAAGLAAARGDLMIGLDATAMSAASGGFLARALPQLISRLSQHDLVVMRREATLSEEFLSTATRWLPASMKPTSPAATIDMWAARREAICARPLAPRAFDALETIAVGRGQRVCRLTIAEGLPPRGLTLRSNPLARLTAWRLDRGFEPHLARELVRRPAEPHYAPPVRIDVAGPRHIPQPQLAPADQEPRDSH